MKKALITGLAGTVLSGEEKSFLKQERPLGIILFARNCESQPQIKTLVESAKNAVGSQDLLVLIDQEGGRVQRLRPPLGRALPPAAAYANLYRRNIEKARKSAYLAARLVADDLRQLGINTNCTPVLDVPVPGAHDIIGDRAYGAEPEGIADLGRAVAEGFLAGGVLPVIKHIPGHGRATADSHLALPIVSTSRDELARTDFAPFSMLRDMPVAMTAHVVFSSIDPENPASTSEKVTREVIRTEIGFDGLLMSDDLSMKALAGTFAERARAVLQAGSDVVLHCNGQMEEMQAAASETPALNGEGLRRAESAIGYIAKANPFDRSEAENALSDIMRETVT